MKDIEIILAIFKSIVTILMFVVLLFIEPGFIYIVGASIISCGVIVVTFAFINALFSNESEDTE